MKLILDEFFSACVKKKKKKKSLFWHFKCFVVVVLSLQSSS